MTQNESSTATSLFGPDHQRCDALWVAVEAAAGAGEPDHTLSAWEAFDAAMARHFLMEEEVLFPALDDATGMHGRGPVVVMLHEHSQMRALLVEMAASAKAGRFQALLDQGDTLMLVIQQHNAKEENVLYPMADTVLRRDWPTLAAKLNGYR